MWASLSLLFDHSPAISTEMSQRKSQGLFHLEIHKQRNKQQTEEEKLKPRNNGHIILRANNDIFWGHTMHWGGIQIFG